MSNPMRLLVLAAALNLAAAGAAAAQTVIVEGATPGQTVEVMVNNAPAHRGTVAADGTATVSAEIPANAQNRAELDARLYVDACDTLRRILILDRNQLPPAPAAGCSRSEISGIYWVRQRSTIVFDLAGAIPDVLLRQGTYDPNAPVRRLAPKGLVVFGGGGLGQASNAAAIACGNVANCEGSGKVGTYTAGATFWVARWLGVEGSYIKPSRIRTEGSGGNYAFTDELDIHVVNVVVKAGVPIGPVRIFGQGGGTYHEATGTLVQTILDASQTIETRTDGWGYTYGGGIEAWINDRVALYGEAGRSQLKGEERLTGAVDIDDTLTHYLFGLRLRIF